MADKSLELVLDALGRAVADPEGLPLYGSKSTPGLFSANSPSRIAAQLCKDEGYLQVVGTQTRGKVVQEVCAITEKGLTYLIHQLSPKQVLEQLVRALEAREGQLGTLVAAAQKTQATFDALKAVIQSVLDQVGKTAVSAATTSVNGSDTWKGAALTFLSHWEASHPAEDCPLSDLFNHARTHAPGLSTGHFHDGLRQMHAQARIYLHPWSGPLYDFPEPECALLIGHEIAYYASLRK